MRNSILDRYDKDENGKLIIKIHTSKIEDLYEDYDKKLSFIKKDLKYKLEEYLIECVEEIGNTPFVLHFYFEDSNSLESRSRLKSSIKEYFLYLQFLEKKHLKENLKNSIFFTFLGFLLLIISFNLSEHLGFEYKILSEATTIGGWVALWEALAILLVNWLPIRKNLNIFKRISNSDVECLSY